MSKPSILISGAGIAGTTLAYWLARAGIRATVIERFPTLRKAGQQIDIRGAGLEVVRRMGLEQQIRDKTTKEQGVAFVDSANRRRAEFGVDMGGGQGFVSDIEILRGQLAEILYDASKEDAEYVFGDYITGIEEQGNNVKVSFAKGEDRVFDLVIATDGQGSRTRKLAFGDREDLVRRLGMYTSYFTIPEKETDGTWSRWYNAPGGRCILLRPGMDETTRAYLSVMSDKPKGYEIMGVEGQKKMMHELFSDAGWEAQRVLEGMDGADDFYMQEIIQVKMEKWSKGRVVLVGDAGYCPSPISGMGTSVAIVGAYILAGEIGRHQDYREVIDAYEALMRPYVNKAQNLPPGAPAVANPQTWWGIWILQTVLSFVAKSGLASLFTKISGPPADGIKLPIYDNI